MKVKLLTTISFLTYQLSISQTEKLLHGKVVSDNILLKNVEVINFFLRLIKNGITEIYSIFNFTIINNNFCSYIIKLLANFNFSKREGQFIVFFKALLIYKIETNFERSGKKLFHF